MASLTRTSSLLTLAGTLLIWATAPLALAQSQADFDLCNQRAAAQVAAGSPSASPRAVPGESVIGSSPATSAGGALTTAPGSTDVNGMPNASGRLSGSTGTGTMPGGGTAAISPRPSPSRDPLLQGMTADAQGNPQFQQAFRDCMKARGF
jgi:hypothetical protein